MECSSYIHGVLNVGAWDGEPLGLTPGPRGVPLGAVPVSPLGDTPGPRDTPFGADVGSLAWKDVSSSHSSQCKVPSSLSSYGHGVDVGLAPGTPESPDGTRPNCGAVDALAVDALAVVVQTFVHDCP